MVTDSNTSNINSDGNHSIFWDCEFTGLHKNTTLISIGLISDDGRTFYAELNDYDASQVDEWLQDNVLSKLKFLPPPPNEDEHYVATRTSDNPVGQSLYKKYSLEVRCNKIELATHLRTWLSQFKKVTMYSDCLAYDWVLFNDIFEHAFSIPENVYYIPFDLCTALLCKNIDPDISRVKFAEVEGCNESHNALFDAIAIKKCFEKLATL